MCGIVVVAVVVPQEIVVEDPRDAYQPVGVDAFASHEMIDRGAVAAQQPSKLGIRQPLLLEHFVDYLPDVYVMVQLFHRCKKVWN